VGDIQLELYIAGQSRNSLIALANLRRLCDQELLGRCVLRVFDILENPQAAEAANILATPTLIKRAPLPMRQIVGDLSLTSRVLDVLDLDAGPTS
jgi:circadian clock protein KaiB